MRETTELFSQETDSPITFVILPCDAVPKRSLPFIDKNCVRRYEGGVISKADEMNSISHLEVVNKILLPVMEAVSIASNGNIQVAPSRQREEGQLFRFHNMQHCHLIFDKLLLQWQQLPSHCMA